MTTTTISTIAPINTTPEKRSLAPPRDIASRRLRARNTSKNGALATMLLLVMAAPLALADICGNACVDWASNGHCQDGGPDSIGNSCPYGQDCADCGPRPYFPPSPPPSPPPPLGLSSLVLGATFSVRPSLPVVTRTNSFRFATTVEDVSAAAAAEVAPVPGRSRLKSKPIGVGACAPDEVITNDDLATLVDTADSWIKTRTGISRRHVMAPGEQFRTVAETAARRAITNSGVDPLDVGLVIFATSTPDDLFGDAPAIAKAIGATNAVAFDLTAACSGFLFATVTASQFLHNGAFKNAVVVGGDAMSRWVDWDDRNTCILFGDGAGAMVLQGVDDEQKSGLLGFEMHSDGKDSEKLQLPYSGSSRTLATGGEGHAVTTGAYAPITMNGKDVYKFATREVPTVITEALANAGLTIDEVDWLLLHQANIRIMESVADKLGVSFDKVLHNLSEYGNTSAGSIPLALEEAVSSGKVKKGDVIVCAGFGAGLSWGAAVLRWGEGSG